MAFSLKAAASGATTGLLVVCALTVTVLVVRRELWPKPRVVSGPEPEAQADWLDYASQGHRLGPQKAAIAFVEFADFECPACRILESRIAKTRKHVPVEFSVVYRHFPLAMHPSARPAAQASECAAAQGRFEPMHDSLFSQREAVHAMEWTTIAASAGIPDLAEFDRCMRDSTATRVIEQDVDAAKRLHASGTPTILINGLRFTGTIAQERLDSLVRETLHRAR
jgi:protein-disulfide isomerase